MGKPEIYPTLFINALKKYCEKSGIIKEAYILWIFIPSEKKPPHLLIGLKFDGDRDEIFNEVSVQIKEYVSKDEFIDIMKIEKNEFYDYFKNDGEMIFQENIIGKK